MKALVLNNIDEKMEYKKVANPSSTSDNVVVKVLKSAINRRDYYIAKGLYPGIVTPIILGSDALVEYNDQRFLVNPNYNWGGS